jgi:hypothetical protein
MIRPLFSLVALSTVGLLSSRVEAAPPAPSAAHPRIFLSATNLAAYAANAAKKGTSAASLVAQCQDTIANAADYTMRGGDNADEDGDSWPQAAVACAFSYVVTKNSQHLTQAIKYWTAALSDDQSIGDGLGCVPGVSTDWQTWAKGGESGTRPAIIATIAHDDGYPLRSYGVDIALTYDWLFNEPSAGALVQQTQVCLPNWLDFYTGYGYHNDEAGANYNAGYISAKAFGSVALGTDGDGNSDGHLWSQIVDDDFATLLVGTGLAGSDAGVGSPAGVMVGGDWGEGWQYGPYSILEYAAAAAVLEANGAALPAMDAWTNSLVLRTLYALTPPATFSFCGTGDCDITTANTTLNPNQVDAVLIGPSSAEAAAWAATLKSTLGPVSTEADGTTIYNAIAETRAVTPADYTKQTPAPPLWYLARGTREMYVRTAWNDPGAFWGVFASSPVLNSDHQHETASTFVFSRGADDLIIDPAPYGGINSGDGNAMSADSSLVPAGSTYLGSQTPWSKADLSWARGTSDATYAARSDFAHGFDFDGTPSDISYAHRDWTMLPEGEVVLIDRVHTSAAANDAFVTLHTNTGGGGLKAASGGGGVYEGTIGSSLVVIHPVFLSPGATTTITQPSTGDCTEAYPGGTCDTARFPVDAYHVSVPGTWAVAVHVVDGLGSTETPPTIDSINDANIDPSGQNGSVLGAGVFRSSKQSYVVASSATDGVAPTTMTYGVPGTSASRHIVFDAPEASDGTSAVSAAVQSGRCVLSITAGSGGGFTGHPLMFQVAAASGSCAPTDSTTVSPGLPPPGGGIDGGAGGGSSGGVGAGNGSGGSGGVGVTVGGSVSASGCGGCSGTLAGAERGRTTLFVVLSVGGLFLVVTRRRRR